jgi:hypothetical protein
MSLLSVFVLVAGVAPHPLVVAAERLYRLELGAPCDALVRYAWEDPELTDADRERLQVIATARTLDRGDDRPSSPKPAVALPTRAEALESARGDRIAAWNRRPQVAVLLDAADELYQRGQQDGVKALLELAQDLPEPGVSDYVQLRLRQGLLAMPDERQARLAFRDALDLDRDARLPRYAEPKTRHAFDDVLAKLPPKPPPAVPRVESTRRKDDSWQRGIILTGATLLACGAAAGLVELHAVHDATNASQAKDGDAYTRSMSVAATAEHASNGLVGTGLMAVGVGTLLLEGRF